MRLALISALKDLRRMRRDPVSMATWIGIPVFVAVMLFTLFGRGGETRPRGLLLVADQDDTILSALFASAYTQGELGEMITVEKAALEDGRRRMLSGDGSALLVIPEGFSSAFLGNQRAKLELVTNPSQAILPGIIEEVTSILVEAVYYLHKLVGDEFRALSDTGGAPPEAMIAEVSVRFSRVANDLATYLDPPLIELTTEAAAQQSTTQPNMATLFFPGMVFMVVLFFSFGLSSDIWKERDGGTLRRLAVSPGSVTGLLLGKLLALALVLSIVAGLALAAGIGLLAIDIARPVLAAVWIMMSGLAFYLAVVLLQIHAATARAGSILANLTVMILAMLGGCFFPFEFMPGSLRVIGEHTPNGWAVVQLKSMIAGQVEPASLATGFAAMLAFGAVAFWLAERRLRGGFLL